MTVDMLESKKKEHIERSDISFEEITDLPDVSIELIDDDISSPDVHSADTHTVEYENVTETPLTERMYVEIVDDMEGKADLSEKDLSDTLDIESLSLEVDTIQQDTNVDISEVDTQMPSDMISQEKNTEEGVAAGAEEKESITYNSSAGNGEQGDTLDEILDIINDESAISGVGGEEDTSSNSTYKEYKTYHRETEEKKYETDNVKPEEEEDNGNDDILDDEFIILQSDLEDGEELVLNKDGEEETVKFTEVEEPLEREIDTRSEEVYTEQAVKKKEKRINEIVIDISEDEKEKFSREFDIKSFKAFNLQKAEMVANEDIVFLSEDDLVEELQDIDLIPVEDGNDEVDIKIVTDSEEFQHNIDDIISEIESDDVHESVTTRTTVLEYDENEESGTGETQIPDESPGEQQKIEDHGASVPDDENSIQLETQDDVVEENDSGTVEQQGHDLIGQDDEDGSEYTEESSENENVFDEVIASGTAEELTNENTFQEVGEDSETTSDFIHNEEETEKSEVTEVEENEPEKNTEGTEPVDVDEVIIDEILMGDTESGEDSELETIPHDYAGIEADDNVYLIDDRKVASGHKPDTGEFIFEESELEKITTNMIEVVESDSRILSEANVEDDKDRIASIMSGSAPAFEDLLIDFADEYTFVDEKTDFIDKTFISEDYKEVDVVEEKKGTTETFEHQLPHTIEILGLSGNEIGSIEDAVFLKEFENIDLGSLESAAKPGYDAGFEDRNLISQYNYITTGELRLSSDEKNSIEEDIDSTTALIFEESVDDIESKLNELEKEKPEDFEENREDIPVEEISDISDSVFILDSEEDVARFTETLPDGKKEQIRKLLRYLDGLFEELPEDVIKKFAESEYFTLYAEVLNELDRK